MSGYPDRKRLFFEKVMREYVEDRIEQILKEHEEMDPESFKAKLLSQSIPELKEIISQAGYSKKVRAKKMAFIDDLLENE